MSVPRIVLALALAGAAVIPASANAFVEYCVRVPNGDQGQIYVCHAPERPGCVYGSLGEEANFGSPECY